MSSRNTTNKDIMNKIMKFPEKKLMELEIIVLNEVTQVQKDEQCL